jgi:hypothetical protein
MPTLAVGWLAYRVGDYFDIALMAVTRSQDATP